MILPHRAVSIEYWIGVSDRVVALNWKWVTREPVGNYPPQGGIPWGLGQPTTTPGANCVELETGSLDGSANDGLFKNDFCTTGSTVMLPYICECDRYADDPTRY